MPPAPPRESREPDAAGLPDAADAQAILLTAAGGGGGAAAALLLALCGVLLWRRRTRATRKQRALDLSEAGCVVESAVEVSGSPDRPHRTSEAGCAVDSVGPADPYRRTSEAGCAVDIAQEEAEEEGEAEEADKEGKAQKAEGCDTGEDNPGRMWPRELLTGLASPWMGLVQRAQALPRPELGMQRMGADRFCQAADEEGEGASRSCSQSEKLTSAPNDQQKGSESGSKLERLRMRKASITAGDDEWGGVSKEGPGRETFRILRDGSFKATQPRPGNTCVKQECTYRV